MKPTWNRVKEIVDRALDLRPGQREAFLQQACGQDRDLREAVDLVISGDGVASEFLKPPIKGVAHQIVDLAQHHRPPVEPEGRKKTKRNGRRGWGKLASILVCGLLLQSGSCISDIRTTVVNGLGDISQSVASTLLDEFFTSLLP